MAESEYQNKQNNHKDFLDQGHGWQGKTGEGASGEKESNRYSMRSSKKDDHYKSYPRNSSDDANQK